MLYPAHYGEITSNNPAHSHQAPYICIPKPTHWQLLSINIAGSRSWYARERPVKIIWNKGFTDFTGYKNGNPIDRVYHCRAIPHTGGNPTHGSAEPSSAAAPARHWPTGRARRLGAAPGLTARLLFPDNLPLQLTEAPVHTRAHEFTTDLNRMNAVFCLVPDKDQQLLEQVYDQSNAATIERSGGRKRRRVRTFALSSPLLSTLLSAMMGWKQKSIQSDNCKTYKLRAKSSSVILPAVPLLAAQRRTFWWSCRLYSAMGGERCPQERADWRSHFKTIQPAVGRRKQ